MFINSLDHKGPKATLSSFNLRQLIGSPTWITKKSKALIDILCSNEARDISLPMVTPACLSEYELIRCSRKIHNIKFHSRTSCCKYTNYSQEFFHDYSKSAGFANVFRSSVKLMQTRHGSILKTNFSFIN